MELNTVAQFPAMPCEPAYVDDEDGCTYCWTHDRSSCPTCHRHALEDDHHVAPGDPFRCPVHGIFARMGNP
jgi:hypothetical protein